MNYSLDYNNRTVDIELLQSIDNPSGKKKVNISFINGPVKIVSGIQKLIQRYVLMFFSMKDSKFDEELGTDFINNVKMGLIQTRENIATAFAFANNDVISAMKKDDENEIYGDIKPDEKISNVILKDYSIDYNTGTLKLYLIIETEAGDSLEFILPTTTARM